jgi:sigma-B regulation protein RsbU (phosphoserine phosphatase)
MLNAVYQCALLVVDDAATNRAIIGAQLRRAGFQDLAFAENGREALEMLETRVPDLILLDILMPVLDGFDTCRALRRDPRWADLPILAMTGLDQPNERAQIFDVGASDLILKPIHTAELLARVTSHLQNRLLIRDLRSFNERANAELAAARQMQQALLPSPALQIEIASQYDVSIAARFTPSTELAGDLWGVWPIDRNSFALFALDVVGHGTIAAIDTFRIHTLMSQQKELLAQPGPFLESLNRRLCPLFAPGQFATIFLAVLDVNRHELRYAAAGYTSPVLGNPGTNRLLDGSGLPLGIVDTAQYETRQALWDRGQALVLYCDALPEARDAAGAMLGESGARKFCAQAMLEASAECVVAALERTIQGAAAPHDDLTLICVMR